MTVFTEQAIGAALFNLLGEKPFEKITVTDIAKRCGINRNTFYYHFRDIYDVLDQYLAHERETLQRIAREDFSTWQVAIGLATAFARENAAQVYNLYNSVNRVRVEHFFFDTLSYSMQNFVRVQAGDLEVTDEDVEAIARLYTLALESSVIEWLEGGMQTDLLENISRIAFLFGGCTKMALERSVD